MEVMTNDHEQRVDRLCQMAASIFPGVRGEHTEEQTIKRAVRLALLTEQAVREVVERETK